MKTQTITIAGLSRSGGSIGLALKQSSLEVTVAGYDRDGKRRQEAEEAGAVDKSYRSLSKAASIADILILSLPFDELEDALAVAGDSVRDHVLVLDLSGGKSSGLKWAENHLKKGHYVGGVLVPSASNLWDGRTGLKGASADEFRDSVFCVIPAARAEPKAIDTAVSLGQVLGATPFYMDGAEYDALIKGVETVPTLLGAAMFSAIQKSKGWRDILRFAGLPFAQSTLPLAFAQDAAHLALVDKDATLRWLDSLLEELRQVRSWIFQGETELLVALLEELDIQRRQWIERRTENSWVDYRTPDVRQPGFAQQLFGGLARGRDSEGRD